LGKSERPAGCPSVFCLSILLSTPIPLLSSARLLRRFISPRCTHSTLINSVHIAALSFYLPPPFFPYRLTVLFRLDNQ